MRWWEGSDTLLHGPDLSMVFLSSLGVAGALSRKQRDCVRRGGVPEKEALPLPPSGVVIPVMSV